LSEISSTSQSILAKALTTFGLLVKCHIASEFSRAQYPNDLRLLARVIDQLDLARLDDEKAGTAIATAKKTLPQR